MDLGIAGRRALICASSSGLGLACAVALAREGCQVWINGRDPDRLAFARAQLAAIGATVQAVAADLVTAEGRDALLAACPEPDILVNNNAGPPPTAMSTPLRLGSVSMESRSRAPLVALLSLRARVGPRERTKFETVVGESPRSRTAMTRAA